jgi:hypothetical protein
MKLTDLEKAEFIALTLDSYDPDLWSEDDLPFLRALKREFEEAQERERGDVVPAPQPIVTEDDETRASRSSCPE